MILRIKVTPNSKKTEIKGEKDGLLLVNIAAPPEKNKANLEVIKFFSKKYKQEVKIKKGLTSREKTLVID